MVTEVEDFEGCGGVLRGAPGAVHDVFHVSVIAAGGAIAEFGDGAAFEDVAGEFVDGEVGPLARAVNGEVAQGGDCEAMQAGVVGAELLGAKLAGGVRGEGGMHGVALTEWHFTVDAVDRGSGGQGEAAHAMAAAGFQEVECAKDVDFDVEARVFDRGAHAGFGSDVDDGVGPVFSEDAGDESFIADVAFVKARVLDECGDVAAFDLGAVKVVEVVQGDHFVALGQNAFAKVGADEACCASDKNTHLNSLMTSVPRSKHLLVAELRCYFDLKHARRRRLRIPACPSCSSSI